MPGPGDLHDLCEAVRDAAAEALDSILDFDPTLEGAPDRQFVSPGIPVADFVGRDCCSQIAVWAVPTTEGDTSPAGPDAGRRSSRYAWINYVGLNVSVSRCIPTGQSSSVGLYTPPSADVLNEASRQHNADGWALWNHMHNAVKAEEILSLCDQVFIDNMIPAIPAGGCAGWVMAMRAALDGYTEELGS